MKDIKKPTSCHDLVYCEKIDYAGFYTRTAVAFTFAQVLPLYKANSWCQDYKTKQKIQGIVRRAMYERHLKVSEAENTVDTKVHLT